ARLNTENPEGTEGTENPCCKTKYKFSRILSDPGMSIPGVLSVLICVQLWIQTRLHFKTSQAGGAAVRGRNVYRPGRSRRGRAACDRAGRAASGKVRKSPRWRLLPR